MDTSAKAVQATLIISKPLIVASVQAVAAVDTDRQTTTIIITMVAVIAAVLPQSELPL